MYANVCELIGSNMKRLRKKAGYSQKQMAAFCACAERTIRRVEHSCDDWEIMDKYALHCKADSAADFFRN